MERKAETGVSMPTPMRNRFDRGPRLRGELDLIEGVHLRASVFRWFSRLARGHRGGEGVDHGRVLIGGLEFERRDRVGRGARVRGCRASSASALSVGRSLEEDTRPGPR